MNSKLFCTDYVDLTQRLKARSGHRHTVQVNNHGNISKKEIHENKIMYTPSPTTCPIDRKEHGPEVDFLNKYCAIGSSRAGVDLRFCPRLPIVQIFNKGV
jgi:hypothetical protein